MKKSLAVPLGERGRERERCIKGKKRAITEGERGRVTGMVKLFHCHVLLARQSVLYVPPVRLLPPSFSDSPFSPPFLKFPIPFSFRHPLSILKLLKIEDCPLQGSSIIA